MMKEDLNYSKLIQQDIMLDIKQLLQEKKKREQIINSCKNKFKKYGVSMTTVDEPDDMDARLIELLEKHKIEMR